MGSLIDLTGQRFGRLTVVEHRGSTKDHKAKWLCKCDCGAEKVVVGKSLRKGETQSCGCYNKERIKEAQTKHGARNTRLYKTWANMLQRCGNENNTSYERYGARNVIVCEEWREFKQFFDWAMANGYRTDLTIERIDNNGDYCPENCRWATRKEQNNNTSRNRLLTYNGETHTVAEWAKILGVTYSTIMHRVERGWTVERMLTQQPRRFVDGHYIT